MLPYVDLMQLGRPERNVEAPDSNPTIFVIIFSPIVHTIVTITHMIQFKFNNL